MVLVGCGGEGLCVNMGEQMSVSTSVTRDTKTGRESRRGCMACMSVCVGWDLTLSLSLTLPLSVTLRLSHRCLGISAVRCVRYSVLVSPRPLTLECCASFRGSVFPFVMNLVVNMQVL